MAGDEECRLTLIIAGIVAPENLIWQSKPGAVLKKIMPPFLDLEPFENLLGILSQIDI